jgi:hypothetical protein
MERGGTIVTVEGADLMREVDKAKLVDVLPGVGLVLGAGAGLAIGAVTGGGVGAAIGLVAGAGVGGVSGAVVRSSLVPAPAPA